MNIMGKIKEIKELFKELWALTRFEHAIMLAFAVLIGEAIILKKIPPLDMPIVLSLLVPILIESGAFALNDYFDVESDRLNKKDDRPLVKGTLSPNFVLGVSALTLFGSTIATYFINTSAFVIALIFNLLSVAYNWKLKDLPIVGNIYIACSMAIPFIFGNLVVSNSISTLALILASLGFVAGLAREIIKSAQDMAGDIAARKSKTLPVIIGERPAINIAIFLYLLFIPLSVAPFYFGELKTSILSVILIGTADITIAYICYSLIKTKKKENSFKTARNLSLIAFFLGMTGLLAAVI